MSLGVLNNLSAMYAENNLNNTSNSLNTVLQQLSSGSKINSGADDAAGLSLVNGLQANSQALAQSQTNSAEGVGLLKVADGALSQVTNLLNRAVTLATEASNGTLNGPQDAAANNEYQSILSEISNIGSTTTYNQNAVFGTTTNVYTGDSSTTGASIDSLNIRSLSSANVGDSSGAMAYSDGKSNAFLDLSSASVNAGIGDSFSAAKSITVDVLEPGTGGASSIVSHTISTSGGNNTVQGLITAINDSGLGLSASFTTAGAAGVASPTHNSSDTGIEITGGTFGTGTTNPPVGATAGPGEIGYAIMGTASDPLGAGSIDVQEANGTLDKITTTDNETFASFQTALAGAGVTVTLSSSDNETMTFTAANANTSIVDASNLKEHTGGAFATGYTAVPFFSTGVSNTDTVTDNTTTVGGSGALTAQTSTSGIATISYSDSAGQALNGTDLSSQTDAKLALTSLNSAITAVAAQDGYIGAQINTLNAVSSVLSTQQQNVTAAQNAVQATDYASAASNMSKYEILSQTGISALAQANSMQQEVTKLLQ
jgi:flagellin